MLLVFWRRLKGIRDCGLSYGCHFDERSKENRTCELTEGKSKQWYMSRKRYLVVNSLPSVGRLRYDNKGQKTSRHFDECNEEKSRLWIKTKKNLCVLCGTNALYPNTLLCTK